MEITATKEMMLKNVILKLIINKAININKISITLEIKSNEL